MPSSISSSNERLPSGPWGKILFFWGAALVVLLCGLEMRARAVGYTANLTDSPALWSLYREALDQDDDFSKTVVLLGGSRIQTGFDPAVFAENYPDYRLINLSLLGNRMRGKFEDVVKNTNYNGILIICVDEPALYVKPGDAKKDEFVSYFHAVWSLDKKLNRLVANAVESRLALRSSELSMHKMLLTFFGGLADWHLRFVPEPRQAKRLPMSEGRFYPLNIYDQENYAKKRAANVKRLEKRWDSGAVSQQSSAGFMKRTEYTRQLLEEFLQRGGRVAVVRYPQDGREQAVFEKIRPKALIWDRFAQATNAVTVHHADYAALQVPTPDGKHIDMRDRAGFTRALLEVLDAQGLFTTR